MSIKRFYKPLTITKYPTDTDSANPGAATSILAVGFIQPVSGGASVEFGKEAESATHRLYCNVNLNLERGDTVTQNGLDYKVVFPTQPNGISSVNHHKEILLEVAI